MVAMNNLTSRFKIFQFPKVVDDFDARLQGVCWLWREIMDEMRVILYAARSSIGLVRKELSEVNNTISEWRHILENIVYENRFPTQNIGQYLWKGITKQALAKQFLSIQNVTKRERYFQGVQNMDFLMQKYRKQIALAVPGILWSYRDLTEFMDDNSMPRLQFVRKVMTVESMVGLDLANDLELGLVNYEINKIMEENIKKLEQNITNPMFDMLFKIKAVESNLREYNDSIKNNQFYL